MFAVLATRGKGGPLLESSTLSMLGSVETGSTQPGALSSQDDIGTSVFKLTVSYVMSSRTVEMDPV